jgi:hypothetical protein
LAPKVSYFTNGADFTPCDYTVIPALTELSEGVLIDGDLGDFRLRVVSWQDGEYKPDYSMTNAGLHIQLPMQSLPSCYLKEDFGKRDLYQRIRFAFLACKLKKSKKLIAICLRRNQDSQYLGYSRESFNGRTLHVLDEFDYKDHPLRVKNPKPVWIRPANFYDGLDETQRWPLSIKRIKVELLWKSPTPLVCRWKGESRHTSRKATDQAQMPKFGVPEIFQNARHPVQSFDEGAIISTGFAHELIIAQSDTDTSEQKSGYVAFGFGVADRCLWLRPLTQQETSKNSSNSWGLAFPTGRSWQDSDSTFCITYASQGSFVLECQGTTPAFHGEYVTCIESSEDVSFKIYFSPTWTKNTQVPERRAQTWQ